MFKLYKHIKSEKIEIAPVENVYVVDELGVYSFSCLMKNKENFEIFIEDEIVPQDLIYFENSFLKSKKSRYFQDYFGITNFVINENSYKINIRIQKLKLPELEAILLFLWKENHQIFNLFTSKSVVSSDYKKSGKEINTTSKFLNSCDKYYETFKNLYPLFKNTPYSKIKKENAIVDYHPQLSANVSIDHVISNLDDFDFNTRLKYHNHAIRVDNHYCLPTKVLVEKNLNSFDCYENRILIGSFVYILERLKGLEKLILKNININDNLANKESDFVDFTEFKKLPFVRLYEKAIAIRKKINALFYKYKLIFEGISPLKNKPNHTQVFAKYFHYRQVFFIINSIYDNKVSLEGKYELLNFKRLSQLYEAYNLIQIISIFKSYLPNDLFYYKSRTNRLDGIADKVSFYNSNIEINLYYEKAVKKSPSKDFSLVRLSRGKPYKPDFIIEFKTETNKSYYLLDAKYSNINTIKDRYFKDCMYKYIVDISDFESKDKVKMVALLSPTHDIKRIIDRDDFYPKALILGSTPNYTNELESLIKEILFSELNLTKN